MRNLSAVLACILASYPAFGAMGSEGGNGGAACTDQNGNPSTLYYCGAYHEPAPYAPPVPAAPLAIDGPSEQPADLPALEQSITNFAYLDSNTKQILIHAMTPSFTRKYFSTVAPPDLTAPIVARIKAEFQRATGIDPSHLTLYAVTDTNAHMDNDSHPISVTYLLPAFFALPTQEERMVALFHENLWVLQPNADYSTIIGQEMAFEAVMQQPNDTSRLLDFVTRVQGTDSHPGFMTLVLRRDIESGALAGFVDKNNTFTSHQLFGPAVQCLNPDSSVDEQQCVTTSEDYLDNLVRTYPKSQFLALADQQMKALLDEAENPDESNGELIWNIDAPQIPFAVMNELDGSPDPSLSTDVWGLPQPSDNGIHATGIEHVLWSLAAKDSNEDVIHLTPDPNGGDTGTRSHLTSDDVPITIDPSDSSVVNGPLSTPAVAGRTMTCTAWLFCQ